MKLSSCSLVVACIACMGVANAAKISRPENESEEHKTHVTMKAASSEDKSKSEHKSASMSSSHFLQAAASGGVTEVELGRIAMSHSQNPAVAEFGNRMVQDHSQANDRLMGLAASLGKRVNPAPNAEQRATIGRLSRLSGPAFDRAYMSDMVEDHVKDVGEFKEASSSADMRAVRAFARETLPTLQSHLDHARRVHNSLGSGESMQPAYQREGQGWGGQSSCCPGWQ